MENVAFADELTDEIYATEAEPEETEPVEAAPEDGDEVVEPHEVPHI